MSRYVVIKAFSDTKDAGRVYQPGDFYPQEGAKLDKERAKELASADNAQKEPLIVEVVEAQPKQAKESGKKAAKK